MSNLTFPQLASGSLAQFPVRKFIVQRTVVNRAISERLVKMSDPEGGRVAWDLEYTGLTDAEIDGLEALFEACEGRLRSFAFSDPLGNLLRWTEDLSHTVWQTGLLVITGVEDPTGGTGACKLTNGAQAAQGISQAVDSPGLYTYTFSVWARSSSTDTVRLTLTNGVSTISAADSGIGTDWALVSVTGSGATADAGVQCSIEVPGGSAVDVFGPQLDAQRDASGYRRNTDRAGLYVARFDQDAFERVTYGPDDHFTRIRLVTVQE